MKIADVKSILFEGVYYIRETEKRWYMENMERDDEYVLMEDHHSLFMGNVYQNVIKNNKAKQK